MNPRQKRPAGIFVLSVRILQECIYEALTDFRSPSDFYKRSGLFIELPAQERD